MRLKNLWTRFQDVGVDKLVGSSASLTKHGFVQQKSRTVVRLGGITGDHGSEEVYIGGAETVEDEATIGKVVKSDKAEADELKGVELILGVSQGDDKDLQLLYMVEAFAFCKQLV